MYNISFKVSKLRLGRFTKKKNSTDTFVYNFTKKNYTNNNTDQILHSTHSPPQPINIVCLKTVLSETQIQVEHLLTPSTSQHVPYSKHCLITIYPIHIQTLLPIYRGRNNSNISGSQQNYLIGKCGSPQIYLVVIWPRFKQNNMTNTILEKYSQMLW